HSNSPQHYTHTVPPRRSSDLTWSQKEPVYTTLFSPDGKRVLVGGRTNKLFLLETATFKPIGEPLQHQDIIARAVYSPDGSKIYTDRKSTRLNSSHGSI